MLPIVSAGLLINFESCTACRQCVRSCSKEHGVPASQSGITILTCGPYESADGKRHFENVPHINANCDLCKTRMVPQSSSKERLVIHAPACERMCQMRCIHYFKDSFDEVLQLANKGDRFIMHLVTYQ